MKVKLLVSRSGVDGAQNAGDEIDVSDAEGARMISAGQAEPVRTVRKEKAVRRARTEKAEK